MLKHMQKDQLKLNMQRISNAFFVHQFDINSDIKYAN